MLASIGAIQTRNPINRQYVKTQAGSPNKQIRDGVRGERVIHGTGKKSKKQET